MSAYLPRVFTSKAIVVYVVILFGCYIAFCQPLPVVWAIFGLVAVAGFFVSANRLTRKWSQFHPKIYERRLFSSALAIRIGWVLFSYLFFAYMTGTPFEFHSQDAVLYHTRASADIKTILSSITRLELSDSGYMIYLSVLYKIFTNFLLIPRLLKAIMSAYTCVLVYRLAARNFGDAAGRISGIMAMLMPNLIYYCGLHLKETEMVFLLMVFAERTDHLFRMKRLGVIQTVVPLVSALSLFLFRTVLGVVAFLSFFVAVIFSSQRLIGWNKRIAALAVLSVFIGISFHGRIQFEVNQYWQDRETNQSLNMMTRAQKKEGGNVFAQYGRPALFLPVIIPAPFPTLVNVKDHENIMLLNGGYFVRNVYAFFVLFAIVLLVRRKMLKAHVFVLSIVFGYLITLSLSGFAISERFHLPAVPFLLIIAGYGIVQLNRKSLRYYNVYLFVISAVVIGWNWFKLAGRGLM